MSGALSDNSIPRAAWTQEPSPPPIPACRKTDRWESASSSHLLFWVRTGRAHVAMADGEVHRIEAGTGIWLPPGPDHGMWTDPGTVAFPVPVRADLVSDAPRRPIRFAVEKAWQSWLIAHWAQAIAAPLRSADYNPGGLIRVLGPVGEDPPAPEVRHRLVLPTSAAARAVAEGLIDDPALDWSIDDWAARVACSARTLRRAFVRETHLGFSQWRTRCRLERAADLLAAGYDVGSVAARCGFASRNGFTRAFGHLYGMAPREYAAATADDATPAQAHRPRRPDGSVPATRISPRVEHDTSVLLWTYRGSNRATVGDRRFPGREGDAVWLPAGREHGLEAAAGSVELPIAHLCNACARLPDSLQTRFPPSWESYLLHRSVSAYTSLKPERYDHRRILDDFELLLANRRAQTPMLPTHPEARAAAVAQLRNLRGGAGAPLVGLSADAQRAFEEETGMTPANWRLTAQMQTARELLARGTKAVVVADRVGYTQLSNFSSAFRRFHGIPPSTYEQRQRPRDGHGDRRSR